MRKVFIVHGFGGEPNGGWRAWLMWQLAKIKVWAYGPFMPEPDKPVREEWVNELSRIIKEPSKDTFIVGHSLGVPAILRYIESLSNDTVIGGAVLVSGFTEKLHTDKRYEALNNFVDTPFNFEKIKKSCREFIIIHGSDDTNVPISYAEILRDSLNSELLVIPNGGHLNSAKGTYELPEVLFSLKKMMKIEEVL